MFVSNLACPRTDLMIELFTELEVFTMAYVISDACISCGSCEAECPSGAISAGDTQYVIDAALCIDCGACEAVCPTSAISAG